MLVSNDFYSMVFMGPYVAVASVEPLESHDRHTNRLGPRNDKGEVICEPFGSCERCPEEEASVFFKMR